MCRPSSRCAILISSKWVKIFPSLVDINNCAVDNLLIQGWIFPGSFTKPEAYGRHLDGAKIGRNLVAGSGPVM